MGCEGCSCPDGKRVRGMQAEIVSLHATVRRLNADLAVVKFREGVVCGYCSDSGSVLLSKLQAAEAIVAKLPKTADGLPVVPGSSQVWRMTANGVEQSINWKGWGATFFSEMEDDGYQPCWSPEKCYSTQAAAEAAGDE